MHMYVHFTSYSKSTVFQTFGADRQSQVNIIRPVDKNTEVSHLSLSFYGSQVHFGSPDICMSCDMCKCEIVNSCSTKICTCTWCSGLCVWH